MNINFLIKDILEIPSKVSEGHLRFLCPICSEFNTATKLETNLARCFRCERNFNTIEMVMVTKNLDFIKSVRFLQNLLHKKSAKEIAPNKPTLNPALQHCTSLKIGKQPVVIHSLMNNTCPDRSGNLRRSSNDHLAGKTQQEPMISQIEDLNVKINQLTKQLEQLKSFVIEQFIKESKQD
jgi:hypothetical protein